MKLFLVSGIWLAVGVFIGYKLGRLAEAWRGRPKVYTEEEAAELVSRSDYDMHSK